MTIDSGRRMLCLFALVLPLSAGAVDFQDGKLSIDGFGSWAWGDSNHNNRFSAAQPTGSFNSGDFALAITARLSERAVTGAQVRVVPRDGAVLLDTLAVILAMQFSF